MYRLLYAKTGPEGTYGEMSGPVTRSRATSQGSSQKTVTKKKENSKKEISRRKPIIECLTKHSDNKTTEKHTKLKSIDESLQESEDIAVDKKGDSETSKQSHKPQTKKRIRRNYVSTRRSDHSCKTGSCSDEEKGKIVQRRRSVTVHAKVPKRKRNAFQEESINKTTNKIRPTTRRTRRTRVEINSNSRQMSLKESFLNQSKIRPRSTLKNTKSDEKSALTNTKKRKVPIYKTVSAEQSDKNGTEVYEFKFDINDTKERLVRKKKKRTAKKIVINRIKKRAVDKKITKKNVVIVKSEVEKPASPSIAVTDEKIPTPASPTVTVKETSEAIVEKMDTDTNVTDTGNSPAKETDDTMGKKPTVRIVEEFTKRVSVVNNSTSKMDDYKPFRPTNVFKNNKFTVQNRSMTNHSLLEKSLSPIAKMTENFDPGSPWRPPSLVTFSHVRTLFQSTPQPYRYEVSTGKLTANGNDSKSSVNSAKSKVLMQRNNENLENNSKITQKKKKLPQRRFGTEITNLEHSVHIDNSVGQVNEKMIIESENSTKTVPINDSINRSTNSIVQTQTEKNKENVILNCQTPKKMIKADLKELKPLNSQKENVLKENILKENTKDAAVNVLLNLEKENVDPQPGPSGLQTSKSLRAEQRILRQSNLNNFLNIMEMPENTTIKTRHGIFDDNYSTPVSSKAIKKTENQNFGLKDAFGFIDDDSDQNVEIPAEQRTEKLKNTDAKVTTEFKEKLDGSHRLPARNIRNFLIKKNIQQQMIPEKRPAEEELKIKKSPIKKKSQIDVAHFSDTFDILSETEMSEGTSNVPLFVDLEPSHFIEPPKHSYKRKRVGFNYAEEENDPESDEECQTKRKKIKKMNAKELNRMRKWIEDVNRTFDEIDHYDLLVE